MKSNYIRPVKPRKEISNHIERSAVTLVGNSGGGVQVVCRAGS